MLTTTDQLRHWIDCATLADRERTLLRRLVRRMSSREVEAMEKMIQQIEDDWIDPWTGEARRIP